MIVLVTILKVNDRNNVMKVQIWRLSKNLLLEMTLFIESFCILVIHFKIQVIVVCMRYQRVKRCC